MNMFAKKISSEYTKYATWHRNKNKEYPDVSFKRHNSRMAL